MSTDNTFFVNGGPIAGVNLTNVGTTAEFPLGTLCDGTNASKWEYVQAMSGIAAGNAVCINGSGLAVPSTTAFAVSFKKVGFAQTAITSGSYGWVARCGYGLQCLVGATVGAGVQLYTTSTAGALSSTVVTAGVVPGVTAIVAGSSANTTITAATPALVMTSTAGS